MNEWKKAFLTKDLFPVESSVFGVYKVGLVLLKIAKKNF